MQIDDSNIRDLLSKDFMDAVIRIGFVAMLVFLCVQVFAPFANLVLWAMVLAVALYPMHQALASRVGNRQGRAAVVLVLAGLLLIGAPTVLIGNSFAGYINQAKVAYEEKSINIPQPSPSVQEWPLVGEKIYTSWTAAADNFPGFLNDNEEQFETLSKRVLASAASMAESLLLFLGALIIAGIMLAFGESGSQAALRIIARLSSPDKAANLQGLTTATVRSVATGVIGVAFIQALLLGVGFIVADVPGAALLALLVMLIGIVQLPAIIISIPVIAYLWAGGDGSAVSNTIFSVYFVVAGMADNVLKPMLLGRGVDAPMPVILIGALGGMVTSGIIGLFLGAVLLAVGYKLFMNWVDEGSAGSSTEEDPGEKPREAMDAADST